MGKGQANLARNNWVVWRLDDRFDLLKNWVLN
jgi:hypothetical protein